MTKTARIFMDMRETADFDKISIDLEEKCSFVAATLEKHPLPDAEWSASIQSNLIDPVQEIIQDDIGGQLVEKEQEYAELKVRCEQLEDESVELRKRGEVCTREKIFWIVESGFPLWGPEKWL